MDAYEEMLQKVGLLHLKDDPEKLQEAILEELNMLALKDDPEAIFRQSVEILKEKKQEFDETKKELGTLIQVHSMKRQN